MADDEGNVVQSLHGACVVDWLPDNSNTPYDYRFHDIVHFGLRRSPRLSCVEAEPKIGAEPRQERRWRSRHDCRRGLRLGSLSLRAGTDERPHASKTAQPRFNCGQAPNTMSDEQPDDVGSGNYHYWVLVFLDFLIRLCGHKGCGYQNAKLTMPKARD